MNANNGAFLLVLSGTGDQQPIPLRLNRHVLGHTGHADISFINPYISHQHAEIELRDNQYWLRDLDSKNGTFVEGKRLTEETVLSNGEVFELGRGVLKLKFVDHNTTMTWITEPPETVDRGSGLSLDLDRREVFIDGKPIEQQLSPTQFDVLEYMYKNAGKICTRDEIARAGWPKVPPHTISEQLITNCIFNIRSRIEHDRSDPVYLITRAGHGYLLETNNERNN